MKNITNGHKIMIGTVVGAIILFALTNLASKWLSDNYTFRKFDLVPNKEDDIKK